MGNSTRRKENSEKYLSELGVMINKHLPITVDEDEVKLRTKEEIINRIISLTIVSAKAMEAPLEKIEEFIERYNADELFTAQERIFIMKRVPEQNDIIQYSWKPECIWVLLWSVNLISKLEVPSEMPTISL